MSFLLPHLFRITSNLSRITYLPHSFAIIFTVSTVFLLTFAIIFTVLTPLFHTFAINSTLLTVLPHTFAIIFTLATYYFTLIRYETRYYKLVIRPPALKVKEHSYLSAVSCTALKCALITSFNLVKYCLKIPLIALKIFGHNVKMLLVSLCDQPVYKSHIW